MWQHMRLWTLDKPLLWLVLGLNTLASFLGVRGMYNLTGTVARCAATLWSRCHGHCATLALTRAPCFRCHGTCARSAGLTSSLTGNLTITVLK